MACTGDQYREFLAYQPSIAGNAVVAAIFGLLATAVAVLGVWYRTPLYSAVMIAGLLMEVMGYASRILLHFDGKSMVHYVVFLLGTIPGATFITTAVFFVLPHYIGIHGESFAAVRPRHVAYVFAALSLLAFTVQAVGCAFAASGFNSTEMLQGSNLLLVGLVVQAFSVLCFFISLLVLHVRAARATSQLGTRFASVYQTPQFRRMTYAVLVACVLLLGRTSYRCHDVFQAGRRDDGSGRSPSRRTEVSFLVVEAGLTLLAVLLLVTFSPGAAFGPAWGLTASHRSARERRESAMLRNRERELAIQRERAQPQQLSQSHRGADSGFSGTAYINAQNYADWNHRQLPSPPSQTAEHQPALYCPSEQQPPRPQHQAVVSVFDDDEEEAGGGGWWPLRPTETKTVTTTTTTISSATVTPSPTVSHGRRKDSIASGSTATYVPKRSSKTSSPRSLTSPASIGGGGGHEGGSGNTFSASSTSAGPRVPSRQHQLSQSQLSPQHQREHHGQQTVEHSSRGDSGLVNSDEIW